MRRTLGALGVLMGLMLLAGPANGQVGGTTASITPATATPGELLVFIFNSDHSGAVDVAVQRSATCTVVGPDSSSTPCEGATTLVAARVTPTSTTYAWTVAAPATPGDYTVTFSEDALLTLPSAAPSAEAAFRVVEPVALDAAAEGLVADPNGAAPTDGAPASAATRWMFSSILGSGALVTLLATLRSGR